MADPSNSTRKKRKSSGSRATSRHYSANSRRRGFQDEYGSYGDSSFMPITFNQHYNDEDQDLFEDLWSHTLAGDVVDARIMHAMGENIKPTFQLIRPKKAGDDKAQEKLLEKYEPLLDELILIDEKPKINFFDNLFDSATQAKVGGRSVLAFEPGKGKPVDALKPIHPRDLGRVYVKQADWSLSSVVTHTKHNQKTYDDEMIYLVNKRNSPRYRSLHYGYSDFQRIAGQARALREITEFDIIEIVKSMFAGYGVVLVDQENIPEGEKTEDLNTVLRNLKPGAFSAITKQGEKGVEFEQFKFETDIMGLGTLIDKCERMIIGHGQVPGPILGREEDSNMATLYQKTRMFMQGPVRADRKWLGSMVGPQWYEKNLMHIDREALSIVKVVPEFESLPVDSWIETIEGLTKLKQLIPGLPDDEILRMADLAHLANKIQEVPQQNDPQNMMGAGPGIKPGGKMINPKSDDANNNNNNNDKLLKQLGLNKQALKAVMQETENKELKSKLQSILQ